MHCKDPPFSIHNFGYMIQLKHPKIKVALLFGGRSAEHDISIRSARNVLESLDRNKYDPVLVYIRPDGRWFRCEIQQLIQGNKESLQKEVFEEVTLLPGNGGQFIFSVNGKMCFFVDVVFPVLHGPFGEDGTLQGWLELVGVPYVGAHVLGSVVGMDKEVMKRLLRDAGLPIGDFLVFRKHGRIKISFAKAREVLGLPMFVKPANLGSSVGVSRVETEEEFYKAVKVAFRYDTKVLVEASLQGREIECGVLGNENPQASGVGEVIPKHEFYSYEAKYIDSDGAKLQIPADLPEDINKEVRRLAVKVFQALECQGLGRVDFFLTKRGLFVNEINTLPGFTSVSIYPKLWEMSGVSYSELLERIITLALDSFHNRF